MPNGSRWREGGKFLLAQNIPEAEGMRGERGPGAVLAVDAGAMSTRRPLPHVEGSRGMKLVLALGAFPKQYQALFLSPSQLYHLCAWERQSLWKDSSKL